MEAAGGIEIGKFEQHVALERGRAFERDRPSAAREQARAVILENHGLAIVGRTPRDAFERTRDLLIACETQLMLEASGAPLIEIPTEVCERVAQQFVRHDSGRGAADWPAWLRLLDREQPGYRT